MQPLFEAKGISKSYGPILGCSDVDLTLYPGEVIGIVGESGSGKSTLLNCLSAQIIPDDGEVLFRSPSRGDVNILKLTEADQRYLARTEWAYVHQNPRDGLRMSVSAGGNIGERLMNIGSRHYGNIRASAEDWMQRVELNVGRIDHRPSTFSGGMQQRLQIARNLVTGPRLIFMDEPTGGLDVSVQARLLDLLRSLVQELSLSVIIVTHDLAVVRMLADRMVVMQRGNIVETGLADQVLDDPQHPYTQLLVSSILQV